MSERSASVNFERRGLLQPILDSEEANAWW